MGHGLASVLSRSLLASTLFLLDSFISMLNFDDWGVKQVYVANHTSMIDFIVLEQMTAFAVIMQKHPGWVGK